MAHLNLSIDTSPNPTEDMVSKVANVVSVNYHVSVPFSYCRPSCRLLRLPSSYKDALSRALKPNDLPSNQNFDDHLTSSPKANSNMCHVIVAPMPRLLQSDLPPDCRCTYNTLSKPGHQYGSVAYQTRRRRGVYICSQNRSFVFSEQLSKAHDMVDVVFVS